MGIKKISLIFILYSLTFSLSSFGKEREQLKLNKTESMEIFRNFSKNLQSDIISDSEFKKILMIILKRGCVKKNSIIIKRKILQKEKDEKALMEKAANSFIHNEQITDVLYLFKKIT